jgi:hypothetical protein
MKKFLITLILASFITTSAAAQIRVSNAADSVVLKAYADTSNRSVCFMVKDFRPDSVVVNNPKTFTINKQATTCEGYNGTVAFVRDTEVTEQNLDFLNELVLERYPYLLIVCGGRREGPDWAVVPECRVRSLHPQVPKP